MKLLFAWWGLYVALVFGLIAVLQGCATATATAGVGECQRQLAALEASRGAAS